MRARSIQNPTSGGPDDRTLHELQNPAKPRASHTVTADGADDADVVYDVISRCHPEADAIIPPRSTAVVSENGTTQRDEHLRATEEHGRIGWRRRSGYCRRSLAETAMFRYKTILGRRLHARTLPNQKTEARIGSAVLNRMTQLGIPISIRIK
jgi:hypothetical protein